MLTDLCQYLRNWFDRERHYGEFVIEEGVLSASFLQPNQYFRVIGSVFNDGVWQYGVDTLVDETFNGAVWALGIPKAVLDLNTEIDAWTEQYGSASVGPYASESFAGYSYTKASYSDADTDKTTWQGAFHDRLSRWRKI